MSKRYINPSDHFDKPEKPYPEFPLFPHANGCWCKKIRGKLHYFGPWDDPDAALAKYLAEKDDLHAGRTPRPDPAALTVKDVANAYLNAKKALLDAGELSPRTWVDIKGGCDLLVEHFGKRRLVSDLHTERFPSLRAKMAQRWGPVRLGNTIHRVRSVFKYAFEAGLVDRPVRFGPDFRKPSAGVLRRHRAKNGGRMLEAEEVRKLL